MSHRRRSYRRVRLVDVIRGVVSDRVGRSGRSRRLFLSDPERWVTRDFDAMLAWAEQVERPVVKARGTLQDS